MGQAVGTTSAAGAQLEDRYFLQKVKLGQGSFGTVWRAVDRHSGNTVAIKQLDKASLPRRGVTRQDIEREISMMKACVHGNITRLFDTYEDSTSIYLALEYCDGGDFGDKVREKGLSIAETEVAEWMRQMCAAILALHGKGICHRDIKPDNFMVAQDQNLGQFVLKLSDFGLAIYLPKGKLLQEKCGTPAFMAPEQHHLPKRSAGYSFPADLWAAGVSMYMVMFGGKHPFLNERGHLDDNLLLTGELDFRDASSSKAFFGFAGFQPFGGAGLRFSDDARSLCKKMVMPDPAQRITAEDAISVPWLKMGIDVRKEKEREPDQRTRRTPSPPVLSRHEEKKSLLENGESKPRSGTPRRSPHRGAGDAAEKEKGSAEATPTPARAHAGGERSRTPPTPAEVRENGQVVSQRLEKEKESLMKKLEEGQRELEEGRRREEALMKQQRHLQELQEKQQQELQQQQELLQRQRTRELFQQQQKERLQQEQKDKNRELFQQQQKERLQQEQKEKDRLEKLQQEQELERQRVQQLRSEQAKIAQQPPVETRAAGVLARHSVKADAKSSAKSCTLLKAGLKCRYESGTYGWMNAVVQSYNESDGTYNLDVRQHAALDKISPPVGERATEAWPPGTLAAYHSSSVNQWLPAVVVSFNETDCTYNLDVRDHADIDRIRARTTDRPAEDPAARVQRRGGQDSQSQQTQLAGEARRRGHNDSPLEGRARQRRDGDLEVTCVDEGVGATPSRKVGVGDYCMISEQGLVEIEEVRDGQYIVKGAKRRQYVQLEAVRAPDDARFAWPAGSKVAYQSASAQGKWIDAHVVSFNHSSSTYNLNVRMEAAPDKVRPR